MGDGAHVETISGWRGIQRVNVYPRFLSCQKLFLRRFLPFCFLFLFLLFFFFLFSFHFDFASDTYSSFLALLLGSSFFLIIVLSEWDSLPTISPLKVSSLCPIISSNLGLQITLFSCLTCRLSKTDYLWIILINVYPRFLSRQKISLRCFLPFWFFHASSSFFKFPYIVSCPSESSTLLLLHSYFICSFLFFLFSFRFDFASDTIISGTLGPIICKLPYFSIQTVDY